MTRKFNRLVRFNEPRHAHALTFSCFRRRQFLRKERTCVWRAEALSAALQKHKVRLWAYVLMPEPVHLLVQPSRDPADVGAFLLSVKQPGTRKAVAWLKRQNPEGLAALCDAPPNGKMHYRFWQRGAGYDRNLLTAEPVHAQAEYIHGNPVRRNLRAKAEDWGWSSAADYAGSRVGALHVDRFPFPTLETHGGAMQHRP